MPVSAERQSGAGPEIRLQAALIRTVDGLLPKSFGQRRCRLRSRAEPEVRIHLPPAESRTKSGKRWLADRVDRDAQGVSDIASTGGNISVGPYLDYRRQQDRYIAREGGGCGSAGA